MERHAERIIESHLPIEVYARAEGEPTGGYRLIGRTPGQVILSRGLVPVLSPSDLQGHISDYADVWVSEGLNSIYLRQCRDPSLAQRLLGHIGTVRHLVADGCGWSTAFLEVCPQLQWLELHNEVQLTDISYIEELPHLRGLIVKRCNNVFSSGIPSHDDVRTIVLTNVASMVNLEAFVEQLPTCFPRLDVLHLTSVGYNGPDIDLSTLEAIDRPIRLVAAGTRVTDESGRFAA